MDDKKVLIPLEEYESLIKDKEAYIKIEKELEKDCEERGLYVKITLDLVGYDNFFNAHKDEGFDPRFRVISNDTALILAYEEIERLSKLLKEERQYSKNMEDKVRLMPTRNLWQRLTRKYAEE